jgi:hypothetical protein
MKLIGAKKTKMKKREGEGNKKTNRKRGKRQ